ncbi:hypothetical protein [Massilia sp. TSP1-1-2]|uniref:hypothetical protein n=1 Tax=Massilia sp. TSP1-1-2 TaxID=2804649 RepID=UPI003CF092FD
MFFGSKPAQKSPSVEQRLEWDRPGRRTQPSRGRVDSWNLRLTPMLAGRYGGKVELNFEGKARLGINPNVAVLGDIEIRDDSNPPRMLQDRWEKVPEEVEGYASLSMDNDQPPRLDLTLYCTREMLKRITLAFTAGFSARAGVTVLDLDFGYPDDQGQDFWKTRWQSTTVQVLTWRVTAGAGPDEVG